MRHGCRLGDLVPVVLNGSIPKTARQRLVWSCGRAPSYSERLHFIENSAVCIARQRGRRVGTKLIRLLQGEGGDVGPVRELRLLGEVRWRRLVIPRGCSKNEWDRRISRSVVAPQSQNAI